MHSRISLSGIGASLANGPPTSLQYQPKRSSAAGARPSRQNERTSSRAPWRGAAEAVPSELQRRHQRGPKFPRCGARERGRNAGSSVWQYFVETFPNRHRASSLARVIGELALDKLGQGVFYIWREEGPVLSLQVAVRERGHQCASSPALRFAPPSNADVVHREPRLGAPVGGSWQSRRRQEWRHVCGHGMGHIRMRRHARTWDHCPILYWSPLPVRMGPGVVKRRLHRPSR